MISSLRRLVPATLLLTALVALPSRAQQPDPPPRTVSVTGEGTVTAMPDMATVHFGIVTRAETPEAARERNAEASAAALNAVRALDVPDRRIQMEGLQLQPAREYDPETRRYEDVGFEAIRTVVVELHDLETLPVMITRVVQAGANRLQSVSYGLQDRDQVRNDALREAVRNAQAKARLMAETLGETVGEPLQISEQSLSFPVPMYRGLQEAAMMAKDAAEPEPEAYAAGEIEVKANVQVVFRLP